MVQKYEKVCAGIDFNCLKEHTPYGSQPSSGAFTSVVPGKQCALTVFMQTFIS